MSLLLNSSFLKKKKRIRRGSLQLNASTAGKLVERQAYSDTDTVSDVEYSDSDIDIYKLI